MTKKLVAAMTLGAVIAVTGAVMLIISVRSHAVNIVSAPPAVQAQQTTAPNTSNAANTGRGAASQTDQYVSGMPKRIIIPNLSLNLPVIPGYYDSTTGAWTLTTTNVQYATPTAEPNNQAGNTFIYGHALKNLFGSLPRLQPGATAIVETTNGHAFFYTLTSTKVVDPSDSSAVLGYSGKPVLTLQTCVGLLYQSRELLTFDLQKVS